MKFKIRTLLILFFELVGSAWCQPVSIGIKGGLRGTDDVSGYSVMSEESKRYVIGPYGEVRLPWHLGVEVDALYRRVGYTSGFGSCCGSGIIRERANSWEFPVLVKYRLPMRFAHPYVGVGYSPRIVHGTDVSSGTYLNSPSTYTYYFNQRYNTDYGVTHGVVAEGGVEWGGKRLRWSSELRYVRWSAPFLQQYGGDGSYEIQSSQNEVFVMVGIRLK